MTAAKLTVLDCTLRDGGYYNDWDFDRDLVQSYLRAMGSSGVDVVELGFRFTPKERFLGPYAYTTDTFLEDLSIPARLLLGVMINASDYLKAPAGADALQRAFRPASDSKVGLVRIAAHVADVPECAPLVRELAKLGYRIGFNIMQSNTCDDAHLAVLARAVEDFGSIEALYFADSLGNMDAAEVRRIIGTLRREWRGALGFHGHDNMGKGVSNTIVAAEDGVSWLDATVTGMGRGAGNTQMEYLLVELAHRRLKQVTPAPVIDLACRGFGSMKRHYNWGTNVFYYLGALHGVHPTYVQEMVGQDTFGPNDIAVLIELLGENGGAAYKASGVFEALMSRFTEEEGDWSPTSLFAGRPALLIAGGPNAARHWHALHRFIERVSPVVMTLNQLSFVPASVVSAIAVCHPGRLVPFIEESGTERAEQPVNPPLVTPFMALPQSLRGRLRGREIHNYGMRVQPGVARAGPRGCTVPAPLVAPYAIGAAIAGGASTVYLAGLDGYDGRDTRFTEMNDALTALIRAYPETPIVSLTATHYDVPKRSVYLE